MLKKIFLLIIFFWQLSLINLAHSKINIIALVNNEVITNFDVVKEGRYLKILNPQLKNLENEQISELAKQSLIKEMIKKNDVPTIFCESTVSSEAQLEVAKSSGAAFGGTFYVDSLSGPDGPAPTYIELLRHNVRLITDGLTLKK